MSNPSPPRVYAPVHWLPPDPIKQRRRTKRMVWWALSGSAIFSIVVFAVYNTAGPLDDRALANVRRGFFIALACGQREDAAKLPIRARQCVPNALTAATNIQEKAGIAYADWLAFAMALETTPPDRTGPTDVTFNDVLIRYKLVLGLANYPNAPTASQLGDATGEMKLKAATLGLKWSMKGW